MLILSLFKVRKYNASLNPLTLLVLKLFSEHSLSNLFFLFSTSQNVEITVANFKKNIIKDFETIHGMAIYYNGGFRNATVGTRYCLQPNSSIALIYPKVRIFSSFVNWSGTVAARKLRKSLSENLHDLAGCFNS